MNKEQARIEFEEYRKKGIKIDMTRGKPCKEQLDLSLGMMDILNSDSNYMDTANIDVRNYGKMDGIDECKELLSPLLGTPIENILIFGNSSLNAMYDQIARSYAFGVMGMPPFSRQGEIKWLCPVPGYDRHFGITEHFGFTLIPVPMDENGPDMDRVEELIKDSSVKGIWCVPKYSNPSGITYSDEVVARFAKLKPAAKDFRVYWDNAYAVHDLYEEGDRLLNMFEEARKYGNEDLFYIFASTSKITFPGSGVAALGASEANLKDIKGHLKYQTIGYDKINELRHALFFKDYEGVLSHMRKHADILRPKFDVVVETLEKEADGLASFSKPKGGYFVLLKVNGKAREVVERCKSAGIILTEAGATHPYHKDESNSYIRIAPSCVDLDDLRVAMHILCLAIRLEANG